MSLPDSNNPYSFHEFLQWRENVDYYRDDPFLRRMVRHFAKDEADVIDAEMERFSTLVSTRWRDMAERIARPECRPYMMHYDGHRNRIDRIVRPYEIEVMEREVFGEGIFSSKTSDWMRLVKLYLIGENGESCISCPLACTEGLVALLDKFADTEALKTIRQRVKEGENGDFAIGAQYLSEIQGGSDIPANLLEARPDGDAWRLYGTKFFCSATHADYAVVTAKPGGSDKPALFVVPSWLDGNKAKEIRNGYTIDRIKWKMGTSELTTGELTYDGALAYAVGPLDRGVANAVGIVLTHSRLFIGISSGSAIARAAREARNYARFRKAFGVTIGDFPMLAAQLDTLDLAARRTTAGAFKLYGDYLGLPGGFTGGLSADADESLRKKRFDLRELIMLQKLTVTLDAPDMLRLAMSVFGGHGVMEDFSSLPRLYRDAAVNELWEGPRNVLLTQIYRDFQRVAEWYPPADFVRGVLEGLDGERTQALAEEMTRLVAHQTLFIQDDKTFEVCRRWDAFCHDFFHAYQDLAVAEVE